MPSFTGNLKTIGVDPRPGLMPYLRCVMETTTAGVSQGGQIVAGSREFTPDSSGNFTLELASTVGLTPFTRVKMTGGWLGEDDYFEFPPFPVPEVGGTIADLINLADVQVTGLIGYGHAVGSPLGPPDWFNGLGWIDPYVHPPLLYPREF